MARLNEPAAAPAETIESLKRKFMRQNRDIARVNSTQSLRIRSLENENSRLLAENLGLRGEILRLHGQIETGKAQRIAEHTGQVKSQLEAKLLEIGALLSGLGDVPSPERKSQHSGKIKKAILAASPDRKHWENMCISEAVASQEGRLPPILENKSYPRKTLEQQEIINVVADAGADVTESPEIGPPPVSQFVDEDPVKIDLPKRPKSNDEEETNSLDPGLSINLEQRRKRRESAGTSEPDRVGKPESYLAGSRETTGSLKTGAKRKLSIRDEDGSQPRTISPDDFKFTRIVNEDKSKTKAVTQPGKTGTGTIAANELAIARGAPREKTVSVVANRKVLAPKSVNDSPRKKGLAPDEPRLDKPEMRKPDPLRERPRVSKREHVRIQPSPDPVSDTVEIQPEPEPETPAALDILSPESRQPPSTDGAESRDTPPPVDLGVTTEAQRPSRRARGAVSYAEPSLRDKMRRPTKELVDAVARDGKEKARMAKLEENLDAANPIIKAEPEADDDWKNMPIASSASVDHSPLQSKTTGPELLPSTITTHRKRRESILNQSELEIPRTASGGAIAALLAETRRAKAAAKEKERGLENEAAVTKCMANLGLYELPGTSQCSVDGPPIEEEKASTRATRRQPSICRDLSQQHPPQSDSEVSDMEATRRAGRPTYLRRQSTLGLRSSSSNVDLSREPEVERPLKRPSSTTGVTEAGAGASRSDRISARRRSMML
ncbi:hypothetical protein QTJ16_004976 [Diplocarpon rosae]|uniref:Shugoshin n=1 Tax=Diplocarpon rosae TaxID=946125 RepID=A0AAD9SYX2_9HELO|nr:hypothetical protein QTJ16_004976 [Diplocarpon rosae]PBP18358.1 shugoshin [Diplocarpon rosae]